MARMNETGAHFAMEAAARPAARIGAHFHKPAPVRTARRARVSMYAPGILGMLAGIREAARFVGL